MGACSYTDGGNGEPWLYHWAVGHPNYPFKLQEETSFLLVAGHREDGELPFPICPDLYGPGLGNSPNPRKESQDSPVGESTQEREEGCFLSEKGWAGGPVITLEFGEPRAVPCGTG